MTPPFLHKIQKCTYSRTRLDGEAAVGLELQTLSRSQHSNNGIGIFVIPTRQWPEKTFYFDYYTRTPNNSIGHNPCKHYSLLYLYLLVALLYRNSKSMRFNMPCFSLINEDTTHKRILSALKANQSITAPYMSEQRLKRTVSLKIQLNSNIWSLQSGSKSISLRIYNAWS